MNHARNAQGIQYYYCRKCNTEASKKYRKTPQGKKNIYKASYKSMRVNKEEHNARVKVYYALKTGKLKRPDHCTRCKIKGKPYGHHEDYSKPLEVIWLCRGCHANRHRELKII